MSSLAGHPEVIRAEVAELLGVGVGAVDPENDAFPLTPMQRALWLGRQDKQLLGDCPDWVIGELRVGGRGKARGYRGPNLTADRFVEHDGRVWHRTSLAAVAGHRDSQHGDQR